MASAQVIPRSTAAAVHDPADVPIAGAPRRSTPPSINASATPSRYAIPKSPPPP